MPCANCQYCAIMHTAAHDDTRGTTQSQSERRRFGKHRQNRTQRVPHCKGQACQPPTPRPISLAGQLIRGCCSITLCEYLRAVDARFFVCLSLKMPLTGQCRPAHRIIPGPWWWPPPSPSTYRLRYGGQSLGLSARVGVSVPPVGSLASQPPIILKRILPHFYLHGVANRHRLKHQTLHSHSFNLPKHYSMVSPNSLHNSITPCQPVIATHRRSNVSTRLATPVVHITTPRRRLLCLQAVFSQLAIK